MSDVYGPWEQAENSDYDEQKPGSGDAHEDEFDDEYGEQRPHGDPDRPDNALEDAYQADIEYWEEVARLNALAKPYDPDVKTTSDAAALDALAKPYDPDAPVTSDASAVDPFADELADSSSVSLSSKLTSPDPDDFDWVDSVDPVGPPTPVGTVAEEPYQPVIVDPGVPYAVDDSDDFSLSSQTDAADEFVVDDSYQSSADTPSFAPGVEFQPGIGEETDSSHFIG
jgi:hypothetical protein